MANGFGPVVYFETTIGIKILMGIKDMSTRAMFSFATPYSMNFGFDTYDPKEEKTIWN